MYLKKMFHFSLLFLLLFSFSYSKENTVVLTGNFQSIIGGENWDPANYSTQMKTEDGNFYELTLDLPKGNYEYKIALNGSWEENYGAKGKMNGENIFFSVGTDTNVTFIFDNFLKTIAHRINYTIPSSLNSNALTNISDFMDLSDTETMFLFQTHNKAKVSFFLGESGTPLKVIADNITFGGKEFIAKNLIPGKKYQYKITSTYNKKTIESPVLTFIKTGKKIIKSSPEWPKTSVFYEVFLRSFYDKSGDEIGDFQGLKEKIPYFKELGINALWLTPVNPSSSYHGYDITDYKNINKDFGTLDDFKAFMNEAKKNNIKVVLEMVFNHTSIEHPWFKDALKDKNSPYRDYYLWETPFALNETSPSWHSVGSGKYLGGYSEIMADLNIRNPKVREELKNIVKFWMDLGVDGFRFPNYNYIDDKNNINNLWWSELSSFAKGINKDVFLIGQNADYDFTLSKNVLKNMDSVNDYSVYSFIYSTIFSGNFELAKVLSFTDSIYKETNPNYISLSTLGDHDFSRLASILKNDINKQKFALSILLTLPSAPFIYYGEELGLQGENEHEYIREPMDWYKNAKGTGMTSTAKQLYTIPDDKISAEEQLSDKNSLLNFTKKLIKIRKENSVMTNGKFKEILYSKGVNIIELSNETEKLITIYNSSDSVFFLPNGSANIEIAPLSTAIIKNGKNLLAE